MLEDPQVSCSIVTAFQNSLKVFMIYVKFHQALLVYSSLYRPFIEGHRILTCVFCAVIYILGKLNMENFLQLLPYVILIVC